MESLEVSLRLFQQFGTQDVGLHPRANGSYVTGLSLKQWSELL